MFLNYIVPPDRSQVELYVRGICSRAEYKKYSTLSVKKKVDFQDLSWNDPKEMYLCVINDVIDGVESPLSNIIIVSDDGKKISFPNRVESCDLLIIPWELGSEQIENFIISGLPYNYLEEVFDE